MRYDTVAKLGLSVFGLILLSFLVRGLGQIVLGFETAMKVAAPIALVAVAILVFLVAFYALSLVGLTTIEE